MVKFLKRAVLLVLLLALLGAAVLFYALKVEPYRLKIDHRTFSSGLNQELRVVQVSDIQISEHYTTRNLEQLVDRVNQQNPDLFLFTGDLYEVYNTYHQDEDLIRILSRIQAPYGKFAIWGNRDRGGGAVRTYESIMEQSGFQILCNEGVTVTLESGDTVFLAGLDDALLGEPNIDGVLADVPAQQPGYSILMTHEPDTADLYADLGFDLILAGHSHGGQVSLPFLPHITTSMARKYLDGLYPLNDQTTLYVHSGIGTSRYPIRLGVVPEIAVFDMKPAAE